MLSDMETWKCPDCGREFDKAEWKSDADDGEFWICPDCFGVWSREELAGDDYADAIVIKEYDLSSDD